MSDATFRWILGGILVVSIVASGTLRLRARRAGGGIPRRLERPGLIALRVALGGSLAAALLAAVIAPGWPAWASMPLPAWGRWLGAALAASGAAFAISGLAALGRNVSETTLTRAGQELVTTGPYRLVRHPLYAGGSIMLVGFALLAASWLVVGVSLVAIAGIRLVIVPREEAALVEHFGDAYTGYRARTGALLPRLRP